MTTRPRVTSQTLSDMLETLGQFTAGGSGVTRLAYEPPWLEAHRWLAEEARRLGLEATSDAAGNLYFHPPDADVGAGRATLMLGSHLDSVVDGGRYDGAYGVVAGLLIAAELAGSVALPVVGFATCEEDEVRFGGGMMGGRSVLGQVKLEELDRIRDAAGISWREALATARATGCAAPLGDGDPPFPPLFKPARMLELHIEQGPVLENSHHDLGIVVRIAGYRRLRVTLTGAARHSGTTPMLARKDALAAASEIILAAETLAKEAGDAARVTAGNVRPSPGLYNVVPGACEVWLEVRHVEKEALEALAGQLERRCRAIAAHRSVPIAIESPSGQDPVALSDALADQAEALARQRGVSYRRMTSGAAHDAMLFARAGVPTLMLFVPSRYGISHAPDEYTSPEQLWSGYGFARDLTARLAARTR